MFGRENTHITQTLRVGIPNVAYYLSQARISFSCSSKSHFNRLPMEMAPMEIMDLVISKKKEYSEHCCQIFYNWI